MEEQLDRSELPIQSVFQRHEDCTATVPVHLAIMNSAPERRVNNSLIDNARETVAKWYDEDMEYHLGVLKREGYSISRLRGYEKFRDDWSLFGNRGGTGFLDLFWNDGRDVHSILFRDIPVILMNQHNEKDQFLSSEYKKDGRLIEIFYRNVDDPEVLFMNPEKMRSYGIETTIAKIDLDLGIAEVQGNSFCSDYHDNMARTLLLRDFAVFYLNNLLAGLKN